MHALFNDRIGYISRLNFLYQMRLFVDFNNLSFWFFFVQGLEVL